jgi:hypothetical protein
MITILCTVVLSVIQRVALNTGVSPFSKGWALQCLESVLSYQHSQNIKRLIKSQTEAQMNAQNNIRQNLSRKTGIAWQIFSPPLNVSEFFADFCAYRG